MKRFWERAAVVEEAGRFAIRLDGRPMRLPGGTALSLESRLLAEAIAAEWQNAGGGKGGVVAKDELRLTSLAGTAQDRIAPNPYATIDALAVYGRSDLLCHGADGPPELVRRQQEQWSPWLDWAARVHGAHLSRCNCIMPIDQPPEALQALRHALSRHGVPTLAGLGILVPATGSLVLGLAVADGALAAAEAYNLSTLDELFQAEKWGADSQATLRHQAVARDIEAAGRFMELAGSPGSRR